MFASMVVGHPGIAYRVLSFAGIFVMLGLAYVLSKNRRAISMRPVFWGVVLQLIFGLIVLNPTAQSFFFDVVDGAIRKLLSFSEAGATFVYGTIEPHEVLKTDGTPTGPLIGTVSPPVKTFAFWILPTIIFFSSLMSVLYHFGIMQRVVYGIAWVMVRTAKISGAESLSTAANIFLGQTEAPLTVKPYIEKMTKSELFLVMLGGFSNAAGGVLAAYVGFLRDVPGIAGHLMTASILSAPAGVAVAKIMYPETEKPETQDILKVDTKSTYRNVFEAAAEGATEGMKLLLNVVAMLIAFVALVTMLDYLLHFIPIAGAPLSMSRLLGWIMSPVAFVMGIPWSEAPTVGRLLGEKIVLTEFIAFIHLGEIVNGTSAALSQRSVVIASYALCGFANFASIGIQLGGIGAMAPKRLGDLSQLALRAMIGGTITSFMVGCLAGVFT